MIAATAITAGSASQAAPAADTPALPQWGLAAIHAEQAWGTTRGDGVSVAVIDSGVAEHPDLAGRIAGRVELVSDGASGDVTGHGTMAAGIIAAAADGSGISGVAPGSRVISYRVTGPSGSASFSATAAAISRAAQQGAKVILLSGMTPDRSTSVAAAVASAIGKGATVVAPSGNQRRGGNPVIYPAAYPGVIGVGAVDEAGQVAFFSGSGGFVDLSAPGVAITSTSADGDYQTMDSTSLAAAHVAGVAALVRAAAPRLTKAQVDQILFSTAVDDASGNGRDSYRGYGLVRADAAVALAKKTPPAVVTRPAAPRSVRATGLSKSAKVRWTAPVANGGSRILGYTVTSIPAGRTCRTTATSCTITALRPGVRYQFVVTARNSAGTSPRSPRSAAVRIR